MQAPGGEGARLLALDFPAGALDPQGRSLQPKPSMIGGGMGWVMEIHLVANRGPSARIPGAGLNGPWLASHSSSSGTGGGVLLCISHRAVSQ
jgi:hypothetical protein